MSEVLLVRQPDKVARPFVRELERPIQGREVLHPLAPANAFQLCLVKWKMTRQAHIREPRAPDQGVLVVIGGDGIVVVEVEENQGTVRGQSRTIPFDSRVEVREVLSVPLERAVRHRQTKGPCVHGVRGEGRVDLLCVT